MPEVPKYVLKCRTGNPLAKLYNDALVDASVHYVATWVAVGIMQWLGLGSH